MSVTPIAQPFVEGAETSELTVRLEATEDGVATVTINRPARRNAFDPNVIAALAETFETLEASEHVRLVCLTGAGEAFSAGGDVAWMKSAAGWSESENHADALALAKMLKKFHGLPQMTVALVDGPAFGGGAGLVAAADLAIATKRSRFAFSEVRLGLIPAVISPYVVQAMGPRSAKVLFMTGRQFSAEQARRGGLIHDVVEDRAALEAMKAALGQMLKACEPTAAAECKALVDRVWGREIDHDLIEDTARRIARRRVMPEAAEGLAAFLDKRPPSWAV